ALATVVTSSILWGYFTMLWPVSFGENWYSKVYAGHSLNEATIKKYIQDQERHDIMRDKLTSREYQDPFKG
ncbi:MAG: hypothetical protein SO093_02245, partial [Desulfovibrio sp.]|nr:hypothetical protein [Desulfovibrio sp.]